MSLEGRLLVTGVGGPSGISIIQAVADEPLTIFGGDIDPFAAGLYLVPDDQRLILPRGDADDFVDFVYDACVEHEIDVLVPTVDTELLKLARQRDRFAEAGTTVIVADAETLEMCLDKWVLYQRCRDAVRVPEVTLVDDGFDAASWPLPAIVKPRVGSGSRGVRLIGRPEEFDGLERDSTLMAQEYLPGIEYSIDVLATRAGEVLAAVPRARLKVDSGIAITGRTRRDDALEEIGRGVAENIGLNTVANVQVKIAADGNPALIEVNPRFPGTMPLTVASGVNMPLLAIGEAIGEPMPAGPIEHREVAMVRYFSERIFDFAEIEAMQAEAERVHPQPTELPS